MSLKRWLLILPLFLLAFLFLSSQTFATAQETETKPSSSTANPEPDQTIGESAYIRLQQAVFDPLQGLPPVPPQLTAVETTASAETNYYFVQFSGPILPEWRAQLEQQGGVIMDYVPDYAYIVRLDGRALSQVQALAPVRWVGLYQPLFRLSNDLIATTNVASPDKTTQVIIRAFPDEPVDALSKEIGDLGVTIIEQYADSGGGAIFKAELPETTIANLAFIPAIAWLEPALEPQLANSVARSNSIMGKDEIESVLGLYGAGQMVAVGDTGLRLM